MDSHTPLCNRSGQRSEPTDHPDNTNACDAWVVMISTRDLSLLPGPADLRRIMQALAALDAVLSRDWESRYYSFNSRWGADAQMASMRDGCGDQWFALFCPAGVALVGLAHEAPTYECDAPKPWVFSGLPEGFRASVLEEPAFECANATFCVWRQRGDTNWHCGLGEGEAIEDGSGELLEILAGAPSQYVEFARDYYEVELALADVEAVYRHEPITAKLVTRLNPGVELADLDENLREIGYPPATEPA